MNPVDFAAKIKAKYPQYKNVDDLELTKRVVEKYPVYASQVKTDTTETPNPDGLSFHNFNENFVKPLGNFALGAAKGATETVQNIGKLGVKAATLGQADTSKLGIPDENLDANNTAQKFGKASERIAEFLLPAGEVAKASEAATALAGGGKIAGTLARSGVEAVSNAGITAAQRGKVDNTVKTAAIVSALFPALGALTQEAGGVIKGTGQKIQQSVIKPSVADIKDGFKIENVQKYGLGGSLEKMLVKTNAKLGNLSQDLKEKIKGSAMPVDLNNIYEKTVSRFSGNKAENFGNINGTDRVLENLKSEIEHVGGRNGLVDLVDAQLIKRGAGTKGSWVYGSADPDAKAVEKVYNTFYGEIKTAIEDAVKKSGNGDVKEINKQISELIPINHALLRRIPVDQRNNAIGLTDMIALTGSMLDPHAFALYGVNKLSKSASFGDLLVRAGDSLKNPETKNALLQRFFGKAASSKPLVAPDKQ